MTCVRERLDLLARVRYAARNVTVTNLSNAELARLADALEAAAGPTLTLIDGGVS